MVKLGTVLVVGGGIGGTACAISLAKAGYAVELAESDSDWGVLGAGVSLNGVSLRAVHRLGLWPQVRDAGFFAAGSRVYDWRGKALFERPGFRVPGLDLPTGGGILRPALHNILATEARRVGVDVSLGLRAESFEESGDSVEVRFSDGHVASYSLVVAADGIQSRTRATVFNVNHGPQPTHQGCWRLVASRPAEVDRSCFFGGGPVTAGTSPVSSTHMYMWVLQSVARDYWVLQERQAEMLRELLAGFGGIVGDVRDGISPNSQIVYRPLEKFLLPTPWHRGKVVLLGDAAHATTPHLASGAGMALEDGLVLAEELLSAVRLEAALESYSARRWDRCRLVVENSVAIGEMEQNDRPVAEITGLMDASHRALTEPY